MEQMLNVNDGHLCFATYADDGQLCHHSNLVTEPQNPAIISWNFVANWSRSRTISLLGFEAAILNF